MYQISLTIDEENIKEIISYSLSDSYSPELIEKFLSRPCVLDKLCEIAKENMIYQLEEFIMETYSESVSSFLEDADDLISTIEEVV